MSQATMGVQGVGPADIDSRMRRRAIISCALGNFVELYDFLIFGLFAAQIGANFFPASNPTTPLLSAFATYGVGFLMRPVGAAARRRWCSRSG
jgi:MFS transporter, MHS family, proline/betaine transporter